MGYAIADDFLRRGASVLLISGPVSLPKPHPDINLIQTTSAQEMYAACMKHSDYDIAVMSAAVADFTPVELRSKKIKKESGILTLELKKTEDILLAMGERKKDEQILVGFALETDNEKINALKKLQAKNADIIVLNSLNDEGAGFGGDTNKVTLFFKTGKEKKYPLKNKTQVARNIVDSIIELL